MTEIANNPQSTPDQPPDPSAAKAAALKAGRQLYILRWPQLLLMGVCCGAFAVPNIIWRDTFGAKLWTLHGFLLSMVVLWFGWPWLARAFKIPLALSKGEVKVSAPWTASMKLGAGIGVGIAVLVLLGAALGLDHLAFLVWIGVFTVPFAVKYGLLGVRYRLWELVFLAAFFVAAFGVALSKSSAPNSLHWLGPTLVIGCITMSQIATNSSHISNLRISNEFGNISENGKLLFQQA